MTLTVVNDQKNNKAEDLVGLLSRQKGVDPNVVSDLQTLFKNNSRKLNVIPFLLRIT